MNWRKCQNVTGTIQMVTVDETHMLRMNESQLSFSSTKENKIVDFCAFMALISLRNLERISGISEPSLKVSRKAW